ncbi:helix-turn-helix domain-containing protein [Streptomyces sp. NPDC058674]|uniref:helix-turn-helix domain-containing protein n=1 Tax=Streptomyces sp. NPDC058674 TaxID=3346592 RepID=UPI00366196ED
MGTDTGTGAGTPGAGAPGAGTAEAERFARLMRELKESAGLSYGVLARKLHTSTSTLHRYCKGEAVPAEFAVVDRFARACGASQTQAVDLHRAWLLADARRRSAARISGPTAAGAGAGAGAGRGSGAAGAAAAEGPAAAAAGAGPSGSEAGTTTGGGTTAGAGTAGVEAGGGAADTAAPGRRTTAGAGTAGGRAEGGATGGADGGGEVGEVAAVVGAGRVPADPGARLPWYQRRAAAVAAASMTVGVVAVAFLAAAGPERRTPPTGTAAGPSAAASPAPAPSGGSPSASAPGTPSPAASGPASAPGRPPGPPASASASAPAASGRPDAVPVRAAVRSHVWAAGCDQAYLSERAPGAVPPPPVEADAPAWASAQRAVHAGRQILEVTVHGAGEGAVVLDGLDVRVAARRTPPPWNVYQMSPGCGGALTPAVHAVNLDAPRPVARPVDGGDSEGVIRAPAFPMRVSAADPVVLRVEASTTGCDCDWTLDLRWTGPHGSGTLRIDDNGRPLRTSAATGRPEYGYASEQGRWVR